MTGSAPEARRYALRLLAYRGRSEKELRERLTRKGYGTDVIAAVTADLRNAGFIDDAVLASGLMRQAREGKLLGCRAARFFIERRGVGRDLAEAVMEYDEDEELSTLRKLIGKRTRLSGVPQTPREKQRLWNFLARKGYAARLIRKAMNDPDDEPDIDEEA
ncbi:MAG: RecX family transcriptional regulator [Nitrospiraceae bacterium]|nr:RecX family transcriptional regulator [Nitrospiraceae bacterium]